MRFLCAVFDGRFSTTQIITQGFRLTGLSLFAFTLFLCLIWFFVFSHICANDNKQPARLSIDTHDPNAT